MYPVTTRTTPHRLADRVSYDRALAHAVLDEGYVCHLGFTAPDGPRVLPTMYADFVAYAARKVFKDRRLFIAGEIIHNPEVNHQIASLGIKNLTGRNKEADISDLGPDDAFGISALL